MEMDTFEVLGEIQFSFQQVSGPPDLNVSTKPSLAKGTAFCFCGRFSVAVGIFCKVVPIN